MHDLFRATTFTIVGFDEELQVYASKLAIQKKGICIEQPQKFALCAKVQVEFHTNEKAPPRVLNILQLVHKSNLLLTFCLLLICMHCEFIIFYIWYFTM